MLVPRLRAGVEIRNPVVNAILLSLAWLRSCGGLDIARLPGTGVQHYLEKVGFQHPDLEFKRSDRSVVQFEGILSEVAPGVAYAQFDFDGEVGVATNVLLEVNQIVHEI